MIYVGIDPGRLTTICLVNNRIAFRDLELDAQGVLQARDMLKIMPQVPCVSVIERQWARPAQGANNAALDAFRQIYGIVDTIDHLVYENKGSLIAVAPATWKKFFKLPAAAGKVATAKKHTKTLARRLAPNHDRYFGDHNKAEAYLLAIYGMCVIGKIKFEELENML